MTNKVIFSIISIAIIVGGIFGGRYFYSLNKYKTIVKELKIANIDLTRVSDGTYNGSCDAIIVAATVDVTVKDHKITDITLVEHKNDRGKAAEIIPARVMEFQNLEVDTVSGATNSSKVILKAIENALKSDKEEKEVSLR